MSEQPKPSELRRAGDLLRRVREMLARENGWTPYGLSSDESKRWMWGRENGPWCIREAIWRAGCSENRVDMAAICKATRLIESCFTDPELGYDGIRRWEREEGRTQAEVVRLIDTALARPGKVLKAWLDKIEAECAAD